MRKTAAKSSKYGGWRRNSTSTSADVSSPTSTSADVSSPTSTKTATDAYTGRNVTVTGGAGSGNTKVTISHEPDGPEEIGRSHRSADGDLADLPMQAQFRGGKNEPLQSRFRENKRRRNPSSEHEAAAAASEAFHGTPSHEEFDIVTDVFEFDNLGDCGELLKLEVIPVHGGPVIVLSKFGGTRLGQSPQGFPDQLYLEGGDQSVDLDEFEIQTPHVHEVLGKLKFITYYTVKHHLGKDGGDANYRHKFADNAPLIKRGTNPKNRPTVIYDTINELLSLAGGEYQILPEGIDN